jgi:hypothetical protein
MNRAEDRAETIRKVTGEPVGATAVAAQMEELRREATRLGVETALH